MGHVISIVGVGDGREVGVCDRRGVDVGWMIFVVAGVRVSPPFSKDVTGVFELVDEGVGTGLVIVGAGEVASGLLEHAEMSKVSKIRNWYLIFRFPFIYDMVIKPFEP